MSLRAVGFVEDWLSKNVQSHTSISSCRAETPDGYAMHLLICANASGIPLKEISSEFPDLVGAITAILAGSPLTLAGHWTGLRDRLSSPYFAASKVSDDEIRKELR